MEYWTSRENQDKVEWGENSRCGRSVEKGSQRSLFTDQNAVDPFTEFDSDSWTPEERERMRRLWWASERVIKRLDHLEAIRAAQSKNQTAVCFFCHKRGHVAFQCREGKRDFQDNRRHQQQHFRGIYRPVNRRVYFKDSRRRKQSQPKSPGQQQRVNKQQRAVLREDRPQRQTLFSSCTSDSHQKLPIIQIVAGDKVYSALIDSGSSLNLVGSTDPQALSSSSEKACKIPINTIAGSDVVLRSVVKLRLHVKEFWFEDDFAVYPGLLSEHFQLILGMPFLSKYGFSMDFEHHRLVNAGLTIEWKGRAVQDKMVNILLCPGAQTPAFTITKNIVPPGTQKIIPLRTRKHPILRSKSVLLNPVPLGKDSELIVGRTVGAVNESDSYFIQVINLGKEAVHINKGAKLANLEEIFEPKELGEYAYVVQEGQEIAPLDYTDLEWDPTFDLSHLEPQLRQRVSKFLKQHGDIFAKSVAELPGCDSVLHRIELTDNTPVRASPYRVPYKLRQEMEDQLNILLDSGILVPSVSDYSSPVMLVKKACGEYRLAVDFRKLNTKLVKDSFPIPNINDSIDALGGAKFFSTLDLTSGFFQQFIAEEDQHKTAITTHKGLFQFTRSPFGLATSPNAFQRLMNLVLGGLDDLSIQIYIDDIAIASPDVQSHFAKLRVVFDRLRAHKLRLKPSKCSFFKEKINFLGFEIGGGNLAPLNRNIEVISRFKTPRSRKDVRSFLGCVNYYRKFIPDFSRRSLHLTGLTKEKDLFRWTDEAEKEFRDLQDALRSPPCLALPKLDQEFILFTDSSGTALGSVLAQADQTGFPRPVAFASRKLKDAETRYSATERELLALVWATMQFKCYLFNTPFTIYTDHSALTHFLKLKDPTSRIARWICALSEFNFETKYIKGKCNSVADFLSRGIIHESADIHAVHSIVEGTNAEPLAFSPDESLKQLIRTEQGADEKCLAIMQKIERNEVVKPEFMTFYMHDDLLCCTDTRNRNRRDKIPKLVLPRSLVPRIFHLTHESSVACHPCFTKTLQRIQHFYYWPGMHAHIKNLVQSCTSCLQRRAHLSSGQAPLQRLPIPNKPMDTVHIDVVGPLPQTLKGNRYIVALVDAFSKWPEAFPVPSTTSDNIAEVLAEFVARHGCPGVLVTDRGSNFMSEAINQVYKQMGIQHVHTSAYHPAGNAKVERQHATLVSALSHLANSRQTDWDEQLKFALLAIRSAVHRSTNETPSYILTGRDMNLPYQAIITDQGHTYGENTSYCEELARNIRSTFLQVKERLEEAAQEQEEYRAKFARDKGIQVGDKVMLYSPAVPPHLSKKLLRQNTGPYRVLEQTSPVNFKVSPLDNPIKTDVVHIDRLTKIPERCLFPALQVWHERTMIQPEEPENVNETVNNESALAPPTPPNDRAHKNSWRHFSRVFQNSALATAPNTGSASPSHGYNLRPRN